MINRTNIGYILNIILIILCVFLISIPSYHWLLRLNKHNNRHVLHKTMVISREILYKLPRNTIVLRYTDINISFYTNERKQTDNTPNITASNRLVYEGSLAISRDLRDSIKFGDIVYIEKLHKFFIVEDIMNKRFKKSIDIFMLNKLRALMLGRLKSDVVVFTVNR